MARSRADRNAHSVTRAFSIVTATRGRPGFLEAAIESVMRQDVDVQHIIVNGGDDPETLGLLEAYEHLDVLSEPDDGLYDAWNKGIERATGRFIGFLNDDDVLPSDALVRVADAFDRLGTSSVCGPAVVATLDGQVLATHPPSALTFELVSLGPVITNARFFRRECFASVGRFDPTLRIVGDREWLLRALWSDVTTGCINDPVYIYRQHGEALTMNPQGSGGEVAVDETLTLCERWLEDAGLDKERRRSIESWYDTKVAFGIVVALRNRDPGRAKLVLGRARRAGRPLRWVSPLLSRVVRGKHRSQRRAR